MTATTASLEHKRNPDGESKQRLMASIDRARNGLPLRRVLSIVGRSASRYHAWKRNQDCELNDVPSCPRLNSQQLTTDEVATIKEMVTSEEYRHLATGPLCTIVVCRRKLGPETRRLCQTNRRSWPGKRYPAPRPNHPRRAVPSVLKTATIHSAEGSLRSLRRRDERGCCHPCGDAPAKLSTLNFSCSCARRTTRRRMVVVYRLRALVIASCERNGFTTNNRGGRDLGKL
jgi:hypothetical protein